MTSYIYDIKYKNYFPRTILHIQRSLSIPQSGTVCSIVIIQKWINLLKREFIQEHRFFNSVLFICNFITKRKEWFDMNMNQQSILDYFNVNSQQELLDFMKEHPKNQYVVLLRELIVRLENDGGDSFE